MGGGPSRYQLTFGPLRTPFTTSWELPVGAGTGERAQGRLSDSTLHRMKGL